MIQEQTWRDIRSRLRPGGRVVANLGDMGLAANDPTTQAWKAMQAAFEGIGTPSEIWTFTVQVADLLCVSC